MGFIFSLLSSAWGDYFKKVFGLVDSAGKVLEDSTFINQKGEFAYTGSDKAAAEAWYASYRTFKIITLVLWILLAVVGVAGIIYSIYLGVKLARAEEQGKRDDAKKHLITVVIAIAVTLVLVVFFNTVLPLILGAFKAKN